MIYQSIQASQPSCDGSRLVQQVRAQLREYVELTFRLTDLPKQFREVSQVTQALFQLEPADFACYSPNRRILISSTSALERKARHLWEELVGRYKSERGPVPALWLGSGEVSLRKLRHLYKPGDQSIILGSLIEESSALWKTSPALARSIRISDLEGSDITVSQFTNPIVQGAQFSLALHAVCENFESISLPHLSDRSFWQSFIDNSLEAAQNSYDSEDLGEELETIEGLLSRSLRDGGTVLVCGNGGSACDAEELMGDVSSPCLSVVSLLDPGLITCISNDYGYEEIFSRVVETLVPGRDVLVSLSTSGNSANIVEALENAKQKGIDTIFLGSQRLGAATHISSRCLLAETSATANAQEVHHIILATLARWIAAFEESLRDGD